MVDQREGRRASNIFYRWRFSTKVIFECQNSFHFRPAPPIFHLIDLSRVFSCHQIYKNIRFQEGELYVSSLNKCAQISPPPHPQVVSLLPAPPSSFPQLGFYWLLQTHLLLCPLPPPLLQTCPGHHHLKSGFKLDQALKMSNIPMAYISSSSCFLRLSNASSMSACH